MKYTIEFTLHFLQHILYSWSISMLFLSLSLLGGVEGARGGMDKVE